MALVLPAIINNPLSPGPGILPISSDMDRYIRRDGRTVIWGYAPGLSDGKSLDVNRVEHWAGVPFGSDGIRETDIYTSDNLQRICVKAGAHLYVNKTEPVYANKRLLCVHCEEGGQETVYLAGKAKKVVELFSGKTVAKNTSKFTFEFKSPDTRLFVIQ